MSHRRVGDITHLVSYVSLPLLDLTGRGHACREMTNTWEEFSSSHRNVKLATPASPALELRAKLRIATNRLPQNCGGRCGLWHTRLGQRGCSAHGDRAHGGPHGPEEYICVMPKLSTEVDGLADEAAMAIGPVRSHLYSDSTKR